MGAGFGERLFGVGAAGVRFCGCHGGAVALALGFLPRLACCDGGLLGCLTGLIGRGRLRVGLGGCGDGGVAFGECGFKGVLGGRGGGGARLGAGFGDVCSFGGVARCPLGGVQCAEGGVAFAGGAVEFAFGMGTEALGGFEFAAGGAFDLAGFGEGVGERIDVGDLARSAWMRSASAVSSVTVAARSSWASARPRPPASWAAS